MINGKKTLCLFAYEGVLVYLSKEIFPYAENIRKEAVISFLSYLHLYKGMKGLESDSTDLLEDPHF